MEPRAQELSEYLRTGHEVHGREFKGPGRRSDSHFFARVVRAVLGMANHRNGGIVVIGVAEDQGALEPIGLSEEELATWRYDDVAASIAPYTEPSVAFDLDVVPYRGSTLVVLRVREFDEFPILCARDYQDHESVLRRGACYVRSRHKPETSEIARFEDMREIIEMAIDKGLRKFVTRARNAGLLDWSATPSLPSDEDRFRAQGEELA
jgi:predicted HTH transcriptional regulator